MALELGPALLTQLLVCNTGQGVTGGAQADCGPWLLPALGSRFLHSPSLRGHALKERERPSWVKAQVGSQEGLASDRRDLFPCCWSPKLLSC